MAAELQSWNGKPTELTQEEIPMDLPEFKYPSDFANKFNSDPIYTFGAAKQQENQLENPHYAGPYLFHCKGLSPQAVSKYVFSNQDQVRSFLFYYFSSITLDYMRVVDAARILLSRIAFPNDTKQISQIFQSFADAYSIANPYLKITPEEIVRIAMACVIFSGYKVPDSTMTFEKFKDLTKTVSLGTESKKQIYEALNKQPIPLFFTFTHFQNPPEYNKSGMLKKIGGIFKTKKDRFFLISDFILKYYNDDQKRHQIGEIDISGTKSTYKEGTKKESEHLLIKNMSGGPIGFKISKEGGRKKSNHNEYIAYGDKKDLVSWEQTLNLISFWDAVLKLANEKE